MVFAPHPRCAAAPLYGNGLAQAGICNTALCAALLRNGSFLAGAQSRLVFPANRSLLAGCVRVVLDNLPNFRRACGLLTKVPVRLFASVRAYLGRSAIDTIAGTTAVRGFPSNPI